MATKLSPLMENTLRRIAIEQLGVVAPELTSGGSSSIQALRRRGLVVTVQQYLAVGHAVVKTGYCHVLTTEGGARLVQLGRDRLLSSALVDAIIRLSSRETAHVAALAVAELRVIATAAPRDEIVQFEPGVAARDAAADEAARELYATGEVVASNSPCNCESAYCKAHGGMLSDDPANSTGYPISAR